MNRSKGRAVSETIFELKFFSRPSRAKNMFLEASKIKEQKIPFELRRELEYLRDPSELELPKGNAWVDFCKTYYKLILRTLSFSLLGRLLFLAGILASEQLIRKDQSIDFGMTLALAFALAKIGNVFVNTAIRSLGEQIFSATGLFFFTRVNKKFIDLGRNETLGDKFTNGKLKILVSSDIEKIQIFVNGIVANIIPVASSALVLGPLVLYKTKFIGLIVIVLSFLIVPITAAMAKYIMSFQENIQRHEETLTNSIGEWLKNVRLVRYLGLDNAVSKIISESVASLVKSSCKQHLVVIINDTLSMIWWMVPLIFLFGLVSYFNIDLTIAALFGSVWIINELNSAIKYIPFTLRNYASAAVCLRRIQDFWSLPNLQDSFLPPVPLPCNFQPTQVIFEDVTISYGDRRVLEDLNLSVAMNQSTVLIGEVGSGKTSFLLAFIGELPPLKGSILIELEGGEKFNLWHENVRSQFQKYLGYVPQESYQSNASVSYNVSLDFENDQMKIIDAIHLAQMSPDIKSFPKGIDEEIGEEGINLSGGQKQRLSIARAMYFNRDFNIFDDPVSSLDAHTESEFFSSLGKTRKPYLMSTHRLKYVCDCDRVLVLQKGKVIEDGDPNWLRENQSSHYSRQLMTQSNFPNNPSGKKNDIICKTRTYR